MSEDKLKAAARVGLEEYLTAHKMRHTPERLAILERVLAAPQQFTARELCAMMDESALRVSRATVFGTLKILLDAGILRQHNIDNRHVTYERVGGTATTQIHLVCSKCGKVKRSRDHQIAVALASKRFTGFHTEYFSITVHGVCSSCTRKNKKKK